MLLQMEDQCVVDLVLDLSLRGLAGTLGFENKFLLGLIPGDGHHVGLGNVRRAKAEGNGRILCVSDPEHLCSLGVNALRQDAASDQRIDEGGLTGAVRSHKTQVDVAAAHLLALFEEILLPRLEGLLDLRILELRIKKIQGLVTEIIDAAENLRYRGQFNKVTDGEAVFPCIFIIFRDLFTEILVIHLGSFEDQADLFVGELFEDVIKKLIALVLR